ncbi:MAG: hypothetical protein LIP12_11315 [Clostridiales bacterium]|nr:hypothetical protein [Clostridiales bacterium]
MKWKNRTVVAFMMIVGIFTSLLAQQGAFYKMVSAASEIALPDPVAFFNVEEEALNTVPDGEDFTYTSVTGYDVMDVVEAYANLLISDYNFETEIWDIDHDGVSNPNPDDYMLEEVKITLAYDGDPEKGEIFIRYAHNNEGSNVAAIGASGDIFSSYTLVEMEPYAQGRAFFSLPDPDTILGIEGKWVKESTAVKYRPDSDAEALAANYVSVLESDYGFKTIRKEYDYESSEVADYFMIIELAPEGDSTQGKVTVVASSISDSEDYIYIYVSNLSADISLDWEGEETSIQEDSSEVSVMIPVFDEEPFSSLLSLTEVEQNDDYSIKYVYQTESQSDVTDLLADIVESWETRYPDFSISDSDVYETENAVYHRYWLDYSGSETMHSIYENREDGNKVVLAIAQEGSNTISLYISIDFGFSEEADISAEADGSGETDTFAETDESEDSDTSAEADESEKTNTIEIIGETEAETGLGLSGLHG